MNTDKKFLVEVFFFVEAESQDTATDKMRAILCKFDCQSFIVKEATEAEQVVQNSTS